MKSKQLNHSNQGGKIQLWHILLLVFVAVSLAVCAKKDMLPRQVTHITDKISLPSLPSLSNFSNSDNQAPSPSQRVHYTSTTYEHPAERRTYIRKPDIKPTLSYEETYPLNLQQGYYTVQVFSGYHSKMAYDLRRDLRNDGYNCIVIEEPTAKGILFKVRIGRYQNRSDAFAVKEQIRRRYPKSLGQSFVVLVD